MSRGADAGPQRGQRSSVRRQRGVSLAASAIALIATVQGGSALLSTFVSVPQVSSSKYSPTARRASALDSYKNTVKTVAQTIDDFYTAYPQPPVLPMYRTFVVDLMTQTHLAVVDSRFKYDSVFALGLWRGYQGLMGSYDKLVGSGESDKIWTALVTSLGMSPDQVKADAEAMASYASSTSPALILQHMEGTAAPADSKVAEAFQGIRSKLYVMSWSIGIFRVMELCGVEVNKDNAMAWANELKIQPPSKVASDLETYKMNQGKLQKAEEMLREIEIREKKKLAERLETKAKALAEKAANKAAAGA
mmetsp:Transcript_50653/g.91183  ORF Transcript_50653/g.91183 Transcript_50653/m.91183 type:complete len:306 (-) Transcript_50653:125-1042(-)